MPIDPMVADYDCVDLVFPGGCRPRNLFDHCCRAESRSTKQRAAEYAFDGAWICFDQRRFIQIKAMTNNRCRLVRWTLALALMGSVGLNVKYYSSINGFLGIGWGWREEVSTLQSVNASLQAIDDFGSGVCRLYVLDETRGSEEREIGTKDGFELWSPFFAPGLGEAHIYSTEIFVHYYNRKMRQLVAKHPN